MIKQFNLTEQIINDNTGKIVHEGMTTDNAEGINMSGSGEKLKYIVKIRGGHGDWCIYIHHSIYNASWISSHGDKVRSKGHIEKIVSCTKEVLDNYGY